MNSEMKKNLHCQHCRSGALAGDKFCRRCGARRASVMETYETPASLALTLDLDEAPVYATVPLVTDPLAIEMMRRPISGPLVKSVTGSLNMPTTAQLESRWSKSLLLALTSLSIWLMIVLLSPLDAYAAARVTVAR